jgi:hypothetical protein
VELANNENDQNTLQIDLQNLEKWATNWGMRFNAKKCPRKKIQGSFKLDGHTLEQVPSNPYKYKKILNGRNTLITLLKKPVPPSSRDL